MPGAFLYFGLFLFSFKKRETDHERNSGKNAADA